MNSATSVPGRILPGYVADYLGHFNIITICALFTGGSILALWLPFNYHASHAGTIVFGLVFGFVSGAVVSLMMACVAKTGPLETLGQRFGTFQIVISVRYGMFYPVLVISQSIADTLQLSDGPTHRGRHSEPPAQHRLLRTADICCCIDPRWDRLPCSGDGISAKRMQDVEGLIRFPWLSESSQTTE